MAIRLLTTEAEIARCFAVLHQLRPKLADAGELLILLRTMLAEGVEIAALEHGGEIATVAVFRIHNMLVSGRTMYVDDLATDERLRSQGHGKAMLDWLIALARERGCTTFSLDSATFRTEAHAFYFRERMRITAFHFALPL